MNKFTLLLPKHLNNVLYSVHFYKKIMTKSNIFWYNFLSKQLWGGCTVQQTETVQNRLTRQEIAEKLAEHEKAIQTYPSRRQSAKEIGIPLLIRMLQHSLSRRPAQPLCTGWYRGHTL